MSKSREKTTAQPTPPKPDDGRVYKSRAEREAEVARWVMLGIGALVALIGLILFVAVLVDGVIRPNQPVASVKGEGISAREFNRRNSFERYLAGIQIAPIAQSQFASQILSNPQYGPYADLYNGLRFPTSGGQQTIATMVEAKIIAQYARENNISVTEAEIDAEIFKYFSFDPNPSTATPTTEPTLTLTPLVSPTPTETPTPSPEPSATATPTFTPFPTGIPTATPGATEQFTTFDDNRKNYIKEATALSGYGEAEIRTYFAEQALREKVRKIIIGETAMIQPQVQIRHILLKSKEEAEDVLKALQAGEPFAALAAALSQDPGSQNTGGFYDWTLKGQYVPEFDDAVWNGEIGAILGPIDTSANGAQYGWHVIQVLGREERPITESQKGQIEDKKFQDWLTAQRTERGVTQDDILWRTWVASRPTLEEMGIPSNLVGQ
ncbi:MAG TPA: peptidylprolyl isomerase [Aggregatilineales bacterium]|nr:peptidylprolyl isomerase [Anaerolineales bacterium]HRE47482.1 peptidylprolyl isomerase [Aggregatilineales bacterium]